MRANAYRHSITIEQRVNTQDPTTGESVTTWQTLELDDCTLMEGVPAEVLTGPGREGVMSGAEYASLAARINMRWFPGLTQTMRVIWDGNIYNIRAIETDRTGRMEYRLKCDDAGVNDGS